MTAISFNAELASHAMLIVLVHKDTKVLSVKADVIAFLQANPVKPMLHPMSLTQRLCCAQDLLPYMVRQQHSRHPFSSKQDSNHQTPSPSSSQKLQQSDSLTPGSQLVDVTLSASKGTGVSGHRDMWCNAYVADKEGYCGRANTLQAYSEVNRQAVAAVAVGSNRKSLVQATMTADRALVIFECCHSGCILSVLII